MKNTYWYPLRIVKSRLLTQFIDREKRTSLTLNVGAGSREGRLSVWRMQLAKLTFFTIPSGRG